MASPASTPFLKLFVLYRWSLKHFLVCQEALLNAVSAHFPAPNAKAAEFWSATLSAQIARDVGLIPLLVIEGLHQEAGSPTRRCLENIGVLTQLWADPSKAAFLDNPQGKSFKEAFIYEPDQERRRQQTAKRTAKRFSAFQSSAGEMATELYRLVSNYDIHGGQPEGLVKTPIEPSPSSCSFVNRHDPSDAMTIQSIDLVSKGVQMTLIEFSFLVGKYGTKSSELLKAGRRFVSLLGDSSDAQSQIYREIESARAEIAPADFSAN